MRLLSEAGDPRRFTCSADGAEVVAMAQLLLAAAHELTGQERLENGIRLRFRPSISAEAALREYVRRESSCCPFLDLRLEGAEDELRLEVRAPDEAQGTLEIVARLARPR